MYEYNVPLADHIAVPVDPARLFSLTIGLLGDLAAEINNGTATEEEVQELRDSLPFSARFFDAYVETRLNQEINAYVQLLGSAAYYLCNLPGSSNVLAKRISNDVLDLESFGLENLLTWLLVGDFSLHLPDYPDSPYKPLIETVWNLYRRFDNTGFQMQEILDVIEEIRDVTYNQGTPRQLLLADVIGAVVNRRFDNSTWNCLPKYTDIPVEEWSDIIRKETFIKEFWPAQHLLGEKDIFRGASAIVQMPTSAGKTKATEIVIRSAFLANRTTLAVIIAPFRALCHEIRQGLLQAFQGEAVNVDELSDVLQKDYAVERFFGAAQVLVATPEKFNYVLRHEPGLAQNIGLIIYDEGHQFDNGTRGITYELLLTSLKDHILDTTQTVLISAVISNANQIGQWLIGDDAEPVEGLELIPTFRSIGFSTTSTPPVNLYFVDPKNPDEEEFWVPRIFTVNKLRHRVVFPRLTEGKDIALYLGLKLANQGSIAIFIGTKNSVGKMCETLLKVYRNGLEMPKPSDFADGTEVQKLRYLHNVNLGENAPVSKAASLGVFSHHNNIPHGIRLAVEYAMKESLVSFVICTSTLAQGVNLPIRFLIVTSVYQGREKIRVRDFQNLIGRSGRSGMHTEGSILFADPGIYDERNANWKGWNNWTRVKELLDPSRSEICDSKLFSLFEPLRNKKRQISIEFDLSNFMEIYLQGKDAVKNWTINFADQHTDEDFNADDLQSQIEQKINIIAAVESYLMANWDPTQNVMERDEVISFARGTLAYFLADEEQKVQIENLFILLAKAIEKNIPDIPKRIIFGKTMYGIPDSLAISNWLDDHAAELEPEKPALEIFDILWPLIEDNIHNQSFNKCSQPESMKALAIAWLEGVPFQALFQTLTESGAKLIAGKQLRSYKIDHIVDVCENGFAYEGILVLGALIELTQSYQLENLDLLISSFLYLQKSLKYGIPDQIAIILYELGFADRCVSIEISSIFQGVQPNKELVLQALKGKREETFSILDKYPSYFSQVYKNVAT